MTELGLAGLPRNLSSKNIALRIHACFPSYLLYSTKSYLALHTILVLLFLRGLFERLILLFIYVHTRVCMCVYTCALGAHGGQQRTSDFLELEF